MTRAIRVVGLSCRSVYLQEPLACLKEIHSPRRLSGPKEVLAECEVL
jgi:hypothetical protein